MYDDPIVKQQVEIARAIEEFCLALAEAWGNVAEAMCDFIEAMVAEVAAYFFPVRVWVWRVVNRAAAERRRGWLARASMGGYGYG